MKRLGDAPELLDGQLDPETLAGNLRDLARVNRWLGGAALSERAVVPLGLGTVVLAILDVGTGAADIPLRLERDGRDITATDIRPEIVEFAANAVGGHRITVRQGRLADESDASYDVVHASMVVHHLEPPDAVQFLRDARRVARLGVVINDLDRGWRWLLGAKLIARLSTRNAYTRNDGPLSVRRAYTAPEVVDMARQAGLRPVARYRTRPGYRYAIVFVAQRSEHG